ncbi:MAG TPA: hypothetical protein VGO59_07720 [Verrucomicrobiae bacterium]|jgi:hypothetical protein
MRKAPRVLATAFFLFAAAAAASAADLKLEARLIWGANDEKGGPNCKPVDAVLASKLNRSFKWKGYFEITNEIASIPVNKTRDLRMSPECTLRIKNLGGSRVEINFIGQGKEVHKGSYTLAPPNWLVLGGDCTNNTAWFIGLRANDATSPNIITKN